MNVKIILAQLFPSYYSHVQEDGKEIRTGVSVIEG